MTSLGVGGVAERVAFPSDREQLLAVLREAAEEGRPVRALGGGKNLLVDDRGVEGWVISFSKMKGVRLSPPFVVAAAGASIAGLVQRAASAGLSGLECLVGVPGTIGGAVRMNAGGALGSVGDRVAWVKGATRSGEAYYFDRSACGFTYRNSRLGGTFVTEVALELEPTREDLKGRVRRLFEKKRASQPLFSATAGCMFKNPDLPCEESAGWLLDRAGMKGVACGGARFSPVHANFVENRGDARFDDVWALLVEGHRRVLDRFGVALSLEVEVWRREEEPALLVA